VRILLGVVGAAIALIAIVLVVGWMLPVRHRVSREATYAVTPDSLFETLVNTEAFPSWRSDIQRVETLPPMNGKRSFREVGKHGTITYVVEDEAPAQRLVTRIADPSLPFGGSWTYELTPAGTGTTLRITEDGEVYNPVFRFVSRFVLGHDTTINRFLKDLGTRVPTAS
jgi:uncharacterized protein YndB with AHSA1/START domain